MSTAQYGLVLIVALIAGCIGRIGSSHLAYRGLWPHILLPEKVQVRKGLFEIIDNKSKRRMWLDKQRLVFFDDRREPYEVLTTSTLKLYDVSTHRSVEVGFGRPVVRVGQSEVHHTQIGIPGPLSEDSGQLGVYVKNGEVLWKVPEDGTWAK